MEEALEPSNAGPVSHTAAYSSALQLVEAAAGTDDDLVQMDTVSEANIIENLISRFHRDVIYSNIGEQSHCRLSHASRPNHCPCLRVTMPTHTHAAIPQVTSSCL